MIKDVRNDFVSIKGNALKKNWANLISYMCAIACIFNGVYHDESISTEQKWIELLQFIFLFFGICVHTSYPNSLSAPMYLAPLSRKDRKNYLYTKLFLKQFLISGSHLIYNLYLIITGKISMCKGMLLVFCLFMIGIQQGISTRIDLGQVKKEYSNDIKEMLFLLLSLAAYTLLVITQVQEMVFGEKTILGGILLGIIVLLPWMLKRIRIKMEAGTDYQVWKLLWQKEQEHENCN